MASLKETSQAHSVLLVRNVMDVLKDYEERGEHIPPAIAYLLRLNLTGAWYAMRDAGWGQDGAPTIPDQPEHE